MPGMDKNPVNLSYGQRETPSPDQIQWISENRTQDPMASLFGYYIDKHLMQRKMVSKSPTEDQYQSRQRADATPTLASTMRATVQSNPVISPPFA